MLKNEKFLITGGSGFIGTNLINDMIKNEWDFINIDKKKPPKKEHMRFWQKVDLLDFDNLVDSIDKFEPTFIIHLAARTDTWGIKLEDYVDNTKGTKNLIKIIENKNYIKRLLITSTQYVYKSAKFPFPNTDSDYKPYTTYGESKKITEEIVRNSSLTCIWTIIRPTNVWGPWNMRYPNELLKIIDQGLYFHPGFKEVIKTYAYVKNVIYQIEAILQSSPEKVDRKTFYLGDLPIDSYEWINTFSNVLKRKNIKRIPKFFFILPALLGDILLKIGVKSPIYSDRFNNMIEDYYAPTNITINNFGVFENNLKKNVEETLLWLNTEGKNFFKYWNDR